MSGVVSFRFAFALSRGTYATFIPVYASLYLGISESLVGVLIAGNIITMALMQLLGGRLADRFDRRLMVILGSLGIVTLMMLVPITRQFWPLLGLSVIGGIGGAIAMPSASALTVVEGRKYGMGSAMALFTLAMSLGMAIGPILSGVISDSFGISFVFYFAASTCAIGTVIFGWFTLRKPTTAITGETTPS